ncbi:MAG: hypothetical protein D6834_03465, partial [Aquificota bacterium]
MTRFTKKELENLKRIDLVQIAKDRKIKNYSRMKKTQLIRAILKSQEQAPDKSKKSMKTAESKKIKEKVLQAELKKQEASVKKHVEAEPTDYTDSPESRYDLGKIKEYPSLKRYQDLPETYG